MKKSARKKKRFPTRSCCLRRLSIYARPQQYPPQPQSKRNGFLKAAKRS